ncbi:MAG: sulfur carrier protein ThiS [Nitriliruptorales bacterium]
MNGEPTDVDDPTTVDDVVRRVRGPDAGRGVAAAVNGDVVRRADWDRRELSDGDEVEVLAAVQGG